MFKQPINAFLPTQQGDQIGQNFAIWAKFYLEKNRPNIWAKF
jgi:hypothetical protein